WSVGIFLREFAALYAAACAGEPTDTLLPPLPIQYADYAVWQRQHLAGARLQQSLAAWVAGLGDAPVLLELPTDHPRPAVQRHRGARHEFRLDAELVRQIHRLARRNEATLFMVLLSAFAVLLGRLAGQHDVVIGTPVANRPREELEGLIGFFVNTLALRVRFDGQQDADTLLQTVRQTVLAAYDQQEVPFEQVVEAVNPPRSLAHTPLFQAMLALQNTPLMAVAQPLPGLSLTALPLETQAAQFDLTLNLHEQGDEIAASFLYASDLFEPPTIARWAGHFVQMLQGLCSAQAGQPLAQLTLLNAAQRHEVDQFSVSSAPSPGAAAQATNLVSLFEAQVQRRPQAIAVSCTGVSLSYHELNARANQLAHRLRALGVGTDVIVALCIERSPEMLVGLLAILKAGGAYLPVDPDMPAERMAWMLDDARVQHVITRHALRDRLPAQLIGALPHVLCLDAEQKIMPRQSTANLGAAESGLSARHLAYVIYTSGSTGQPKGVMVEHAQVMRLFAATAAGFHFDEQDVWSLFHSFAFDFSVWEIWGALLHGGQLVIVPQLVTRSPHEFYQLLCETGVTILNQTPSAFRALIAAQAEMGRMNVTTGGGGNSLSHRLRCIIFGGEALDMHLLQAWLARNDLQQTQLVNMYGITETTVHVTWKFLTQADIEQDSGHPIGVAIPDLQIYLLDDAQQPVPIGVTGEIYVGGDGLARGYLGRPELTAARFIAHPWSDNPAARLYKSGDLARWRADGSLDYLGRNDHQVKIRGFRIELGEIEARLAEQPAIREAVVIVREDRPGDPRLVAYLTRQPAHDFQLETLRLALRRSLPEYMLPAAYVMLDSLPLTVNGKLDVRALPMPEAASPDATGAEWAAPQGALEMLLAELWQTLLQRKAIGRHDHFFELGGHSLLAVQVNSRLRQLLEREIPLRMHFEHPVLAEFAHHVGRIPSVLQEAPIPRLTAQARAQPLPLSWSQQRLWFLDRLDAAASHAYHIPGIFELHGKLDTEALQWALDALVARHDILRTTVHTRAGAGWQCVADCAGFALEQQDLSRTASTRRKPPEAVASLLDAALRRPFDLASGPLIRGLLIKTAATRHTLCIDMHHIIADGWSIGLLADEVATLYRARLAGCTNPASVLSPLPLQYADYACWQRQWLAGERLQAQLAYWQQQLGDAPALLELPSDRPRPPLQSYLGASRPLSLDARLTQALKQYAQSQEATLFMVLLAGYALLLGRLAGQQDVVIGTPVANRPRQALEGLIGFFVNTLALRVRLDPAATCAQLLQALRQDTLAAWEHQDTPFEQVVEALNPARSLAHSPVFQAMLALQNLPQKQIDLPGLRLEAQALATHTTQFDLSFNLHENGDILQGDVHYATDLFDAETIDRWVQLYQHILQDMVASQGQRPQQAVAWLSEAERQQLLEGGHAPRLPVAAEATLVSLFEAQVRGYPERIALRHVAQQITYAALNRRANQLAHRLCARGVAPGQRVALCVERGIDMIVGLLGILKAGAAYVPLDPDYPAERIARMLADAQPSLVLTLSSRRALLAETTRIPPADILALDDDEPRIAQHAEAEAEIEADPGAQEIGLQEIDLQPQHLAYVMYTSGSTGQPKGVMLEHRGLVNLVRAMQLYHPPAAHGHHHLLQFASISFDMSVEEIFGALCSGYTLVIRTDAWIADAPSFWQHCAEAGLSLLNLPTAYWHQLAQDEQAAIPAGIQQIFIGGEAVNTEIVRRWFQRAGHRPLLMNAYGPTETSVNATLRAMDATDATSRLIGAPIANTRIYILDPHGQPQPVGVVGEIFIGGLGVARGYHERPELTAERFLPDPHNPAPDARMYRTGDLGRWQADGQIEYLGRNDFQVKIRGFRIELGEIEAHLRRDARVRESVVLAREERQGERRLVAYLVLQADRRSHDEIMAALRAQLKAGLPDYMQPSAFVLLDALPLLPNGKLNRAALPAPAQTAYRRQGHVAPQGEIEATLAAIWQELLSLEQVGRHDHFFDLGGHSLLIVQLIERLRRAGLNLDVRSVFLHPTLEALASHLEAQAADGSLPLRFEAPPNRIPPGCTAITPDMLPLVRLTPAQIDLLVAQIPGGAAQVQDIYPLAPLQEGLLFHHLLDTTGDAYVLPMLMEFASTERLAAFLAALQVVIARHDILRTAFFWQGLDAPLQVVHREVALSVETLLPTPLPVSPQSVRALLEDRMRHAVQPMNLQQAPLIRLTMAQDAAAADAPCVLLLQLHHLISDHVSLELAIEEIMIVLAGEAHSLPSPVPYREFVAQTRAAEGGQRHGLAYFRTRLADIEAPTAPYGLLDVRGDGRSVREARQAVEASLGQRTLDAARHLQVSPATLFHVAWALVVARTSGRDDVVFGSVLSGRLQGTAGADRVLGMFINTLPVRCALHGRSAQEAVMQMHGDLIELLRHEQASLAQVQRESAVPAHLPLFTAVLNYRHTAPQESKPADIPGMRVLASQERTNYPFVMSVDDFAGRFELVAQVAQHEHPMAPEQVTALLHAALNALVDALMQPAAQPAMTPLQTLDILSAEQRRWLLGQQGRPCAAAVPSCAAASPQFLPHRITEQARQQPATAAIDFDGSQLSYQDLDHRSNQLA
ncbi:MAG: amino acid adenylation domain-containing protein, partial [Sterolibacterium sp.]|nr:amino acid adenylation domain-containing protein [Sterolibacterium sp.]